MADETLNGANGENGANEASEASETKKANGAGEGNETKKASKAKKANGAGKASKAKKVNVASEASDTSKAGEGNETSEATSQNESQKELKEPNWEDIQRQNKQTAADSIKALKRKFADNFRIKYENDKFVPNNEQLRALVKVEGVRLSEFNIKLSEIDTSEVTDMSFLFCRHTNLPAEKRNKIGNPLRKDFSGIGEWDTSKVETFESMFYFAAEFNEDISGWDTSSAKSFRYMFYHASQFNQPIGKWNTSSVTDMSGMFSRAYDFNQPLDKWDISNVVKMTSMFANASSFNQDLSAWGDKLGRVQDMSEMFSGTKALNLDFLNSWVISSECDTAYMTKARDVSWDELKDSYEIKHIKRNKKGQFVPKNKQLRMLVKYEEVKLSDIDTSEVTEMRFLFNKYGSLLDFFKKEKSVRKDFSGISEWDTSRVTTFEGMFFNAENFNEDISKWKIDNAQNLSFMFYNAKNFNQNINDWDVSKVGEFSYVFTCS